MLLPLATSFSQDIGGFFALIAVGGGIVGFSGAVVDGEWGCFPIALVLVVVCGGIALLLR